MANHKILNLSAKGGSALGGKSKILKFPKKPGVYQFIDKKGQVLYVGKAKNLRSRVRQYFGKSDERPQIPYLLNDATDVTYTVVNNELESLYLENTLIKQYLPKYNILLRDDKNYSFIVIDYSTQIPQITTSRHLSDSNSKFQISNPKSVYFGPYTAAYKIRNTLNLVRKIFPYCSARKVSSRPCFYYYMHRCPGVCVGKISLGDYARHLEKIVKFLRGDTAGVIFDIKKEMLKAAKAKKFETAARLRDQLRALELLTEKQNVILAKKVDWDIVSLADTEGYACINLFKIRGGKMFDKENFVYENKYEPIPTQGRNPDWNVGADVYRIEIIQTFYEQYYLETSDAPREIFLQLDITDTNTIKSLLKARFGKTLKISVPQKGKVANLIRLGTTNAEEYLKNWLADKAGNLDKINAALAQLKDVLKLSQIPKRIECYDISNIQGTNAVGSMVVFVDGLPAKSQYRKFKIQNSPPGGGPDDFAMMKEMLARRMSRLQFSPSAKEGWRPQDDGVVFKPEQTPNTSPRQRRVTPPSKGGEKNAWPLPDLIVIDGGRGQLSAALEVLTTYNLQLTTPAIGLAKRIEEIFIPGKKNSIIVPHDQPALQLLQRLRDEAHRFGITFHRQLRSKQAIKSALDDIPGIGPKTKKLLKAKFGTVEEIKRADFNELVKVVGSKIANTIKQKL